MAGSDSRGLIRHGDCGVERLGRLGTGWPWSESIGLDWSGVLRTGKAGKARNGMELMGWA